MENVVRLEDIPEFVERTISAVRDGIALARKTGVLAELPKEIQFDMTVIGTWQSADLAIVSTDTSTGSDHGGSTTVNEGNGTSTSNDTGISTGATTSDGTSTSNDTGISTGTNTSNGTRSGTETSTSTGNDGSNSGGQNVSYSYNR